MDGGFIFFVGEVSPGKLERMMVSEGFGGFVVVGDGHLVVAIFQILLNFRQSLTHPNCYIN